MIPYRYKEQSVFYSLLKDDAVTYDEPALDVLYKQAMGDLRHFDTIEDYRIRKPGELLLRMARVEADKEMNMLREIFGINLNISFKSSQDVKDLTEAINSVFHFKSVAERNMDMITNPDFKSGIKAVFSWYPTYFNKAFREAEQQLFDKLLPVWVGKRTTPIGKIAEAEFKKILPNIISRSITMMFEKAEVEETVDPKYIHAYREIADAIRTDFLLTGDNIFLNRIKSIYNLDRVADSFGNAIQALGTLDVRAARYQAQQELLKGENIHTKGGYTLEGLVDQVIGMVANEIDGTKTANGDTITASTRTSFGKLNARPDNILYFNIPESEIDQVINKIEDTRSKKIQTRLTDADAIQELMYNIRNISNGYMVYFNDKNYNIGSGDGHQAAKNVKLADLDTILASSPINLDDLIFNILQTTKGAIGEGNDYGASEVIAQQVAYFLFDDWQTIGTAQVGGNAIHIMSLEGIMVPLSAFLYAMGTAIIDVQSHVSGFARATITSPKILFPEGEKEGGRGARFIKKNWAVQQKDAFDKIKIKVVFLQTMQSFISKYIQW